MQQGWLAAGVAFALAAALVIVAIPPEPSGDLEPAAFEDDEAMAIAAMAEVRRSGIAEMPRWEVGDAWNVQFAAGEPVCWAVIVEANEEGYQQGIWCSTDEAAFIATQVAVLDLPYLGRFTADLEGRAGEDATRWFDWPLEDGKTWTTTYRGDEVSVSATLDDARFELVMTFADGDVLARYDYDPAKRWWSKLEFESGFAFLVHGARRDWDGGATKATAIPRASGAGSSYTASFLSFPAEENETFVVILRQKPASAVHYFDLTQPDGTVAQATPSAPLVNLGPTGTTTYQVYDAQPGVWQYREAGAGLGEFFVRVFTATVEEVVL